MRKKILLLMTIVLILATVGGGLEAQKIENQNVTNETNLKAALADKGNVTLDADINVATQTEILAEYVVQIGDVKYQTLQAAFDAAQSNDEIILLDNVQLDTYVTINKSVTINLGEYNIKCGQKDGEDRTALYVNGDVVVNINGTTGKVTGRQALYVNKGLVKINGGSFFGTNINAEAVYVINQGNVEIYGGTFDGQGSNAHFVLNEYDATREATDITVYGGTFVGFNPQDNAAEGAGTNFCAPGYIAQDNGDGTYTVIIDPAIEGEAMIDGVGYPTLELAIEAAQENDEIVILKDVTRSNIVVLNKAVTLNGNYKTLTSTMSGTSGRALNVNVEGNVTVKNLTINASGQRGINVIQKPANLTIENVTVTAANYAVNLATSASSGENGPQVQINNSEFTGLNTINIAAPYTVMNIDGIVLTCNDQNPKESYGAISINVDGPHSVVYVTNYDFTVLDDSEWAQVSAEDSYVHFDPSQEVQYDNVAVYAYEGANYYYSYPTLKEAIESSKTVDGAYIKLVNSCQGSGVVINKSVTIDFNGKTYSFTTPAVGSQGTESNGFQILRDNTVTLKNGTLNVTSEAKSAYYILIQNYSNLTVHDMTLDGKNLDKYSTSTNPNDGDSYVLSNNFGTVNVTGFTNIFANDESSANPSRAFAFDACDKREWGYQPMPTVTVNTTGTIKGVVEVSAILNLEAVGVNEISNVVISGEGQLFHNGLETTIVKHITGHVVPENNSEYADGWYTISSPVGTVGHDKVDGLLNGTYDLYRYDEATMMWENVKDVTNEDFTTLEACRGYLYANSADTELSFTGTLNTAAAEQLLTVTENSLSGFNLIGNPFTYNITKANMSGVSLAEGFYTLSNQGAWQANAQDATIAPMQGALIKAEETATITINPNSAKRNTSEDNAQIKIEVSNDNYNDVAYVSFSEGTGLDKINHRNANVPMVYVPVGGINYAIATMNQDVTEIPVSFNAMTMGKYTIGAEAQGCEYAMMTLVDRFTGTETNLLLEDYAFVATTKDNAERFIIKLAKINADDENEDNFAFINNGMMYIYNIEGQGMVGIYDVIGRPVAEFNVETSAYIPTSELSTGIYIIKMTDNSGVKVQKVLID